MGCGQSKEVIAYDPEKHQSLDDIIDEFQARGFDAANMIVGIDATISNDSQGLKTFDGLSLHSISRGQLNPYQECIDILGRTMEEFTAQGASGKIPAYLFGDKLSQDKGLINLKPGNFPCNDFEEVLTLYEDCIENVDLGAPTTFAPLIYESINHVIESGYEYHVLFIIADGEISEANVEETKDAIVRASSYPMSIIMIGVGDGPWDRMIHFDDELPKRRFDNFNFVNFFEEMHKHHFETEEQRQAHFAFKALVETPFQYGVAARLKLGTTNRASDQLHNIPVYNPPEASGSSFTSS